MEGQWIIFGFGKYLSDIFDNIYANGDRVKAIVSNIDVEWPRAKDLEHRIALMGRDIPVIGLEDFRPEGDEKYIHGFFKGLEPAAASLKSRYGLEFSRLVHPTAYIGQNVTLGEGVFISPGVIIAPNCTIGSFTRVNRASSIGHDSRIGRFADIAPGVNLASSVSIGDRTTIGIGATVIEDVHIGEDAMVGAGAAVVGDVPDGVVVVGVPAKFLRRNVPEAVARVR